MSEMTLLQEAVAFIQKKVKVEPKIGLILGSGLGMLAAARPKACQGRRGGLVLPPISIPNWENPNQQAADRVSSARCSRQFYGSPIEQGCDPLGQSRGDLALCHDRPIFDTVSIDQVDFIAVAAESSGSRRDIIGEYPIAALTLTLEAGIVDDIVRLRRKTNDEGRPVVAALRDTRENVRVLHELQYRQATPIFL